MFPNAVSDVLLVCLNCNQILSTRLLWIPNLGAISMEQKMYRITFLHRQNSGHFHGFKHYPFEKIFYAFTDFQSIFYLFDLPLGKLQIAQQIKVTCVWDHKLWKQIMAANITKIRTHSLLIWLELSYKSNIYYLDGYYCSLDPLLYETWERSTIID